MICTVTQDYILSRLCVWSKTRKTKSLWNALKYQKKFVLWFEQMLVVWSTSHNQSQVGFCCMSTLASMWTFALFCKESDAICCAVVGDAVQDMYVTVQLLHEWARFTWWQYLHLSFEVLHVHDNVCLVEMWGLRCIHLAWNEWISSQTCYFWLQFCAIDAFMWACILSYKRYWHDYEVDSRCVQVRHEWDDRPALS
jgi:hypothetical protein